MLCSRWELTRRPCKDEYKLIDCKHMVSRMLEDRKVWDKCQAMVMSIMKSKEAEERARQVEEGRNA